MRFFMPADVYVEKDAVKNHAAQLAALGTRALIVTGSGSSKKNGSLKDVTDALDENSVPYEIFFGVEENPSVDTIAKATDQAKAFGADFMIGVGGGSAMDAAKAIALLAGNPDETTDCLYNKKDLKALPVAAVATTCGTGSEVTGVSVLTRHDTQTKGSIPYRIYPALALVDGKYLMSASHNLIVNTSVDALSHSIESYLHSTSNEYNRMLSASALRMWKEVIPILTGEEEVTEESAQKLMLVSTIAGMAIAQTATSLPHALSYEVTYRKNIPHGKACGLFQAAYLRKYAAFCKKDVENVLSFIGFDDIDSFGEFLTSLLGKPEFTEDEIASYSANISSSKLTTFPFPVAVAELGDLYRESFTIV